MNDKISIIIPVYNTASYLNKCLNSVINQDYSNLEIILINDESTDESLNICNNFAKRDGRIIVLNMRKCGPSICRYVGVSRATGKFLSFIDSDDYVTGDYISYLYGLLKINNADISICGINHNKESNSVKENIRIFSSNQVLKEILNFNQSINTSLHNKLFKSSLVKQEKNPIISYYEDIVLVPRILRKASRIVVSNIPKYYYYIREDSICNSNYSLHEYDKIVMTNILNNYIINYYPKFMKQGQLYSLCYRLSICDKIIIQGENPDFILITKKIIEKQFLFILFSNFNKLKKIQLLLFLNKKGYLKFLNNKKQIKRLIYK